MADERSRPPFNKPSPAPKKFAWPTLLKLDGEALEAHYRKLLQELGARGGEPAFRQGQKRITRQTWFECPQTRLAGTLVFA
jgi:type I restriction enzyme M protein